MCLCCVYLPAQVCLLPLTGRPPLSVYGSARGSFQVARLDPADYTLHGFRHGSIQSAMLVEDNMAMVALTSDHSSSAIEAYTRIPATSRMRVCAKVVRLLHST